MEELDLKELFTIFWERKVQIVIIVLIFAVIGIIYSYFLTTPDYQASTTLVLTQSVADTEDGAISSDDINLNAKLVSTYGELIKTENILLEVVENINNPEITIEDIKENVSVEAVNNTEVLKIIVTNEDPNYAATVANEIAKVFCEKIVEIYNISNTYILDRAKPDEEPYNINHIRDIAIFVFIGVIVSAIYVFIANMLDNTIKTEQDIEKTTGLIVLTCIPDYTLESKRGGRKK